MIHQPNFGNTVYEVAIYNKDVRALVKENQSHSFYEDHWADEQHQDVRPTRHRHGYGPRRRQCGPS